MADHDVQVHAEPNNPGAGAFDVYAIVVTCTCGAILGEFTTGPARPGELWRLEQDHRIATATAGPTPGVNWPSRPVTCCDCGGIEFTRWAEDRHYLQCANPDCCHVCAHPGAAMSLPQPLPTRHHAGVERIEQPATPETPTAQTPKPPPTPPTPLG